MPLTETEARSLEDITDNWKVIARRIIIGDEAAWQYCGSIHQQWTEFRRLAFPLAGATPLVSVVTGRDGGGRLTLYARIMPVVPRRIRR